MSPVPDFGDKQTKVKAGFPYDRYDRSDRWKKHLVNDRAEGYLSDRCRDC